MVSDRDEKRAEISCSARDCGDFGRYADRTPSNCPP
jgi:hypothetical protein